MSNITDFKIIYRLAKKKGRNDEIIEGMQVFVNLETMEGLVAIHEPGDHGIGEAMDCKMEGPAMVRMAKIILRVYAKKVRDEEEKQNNRNEYF
ncbi:MAG: hypothetical protein GPJ52_00730 [Candidatus Heimdallarchaeota archaeon]|nr:hypothetical protein [Candidatus Heimdallarchaeota archaeon]